MGLFNDCEKYFNTKDLYEVLGTSHNASDAECIKTSFVFRYLVFHTIEYLKLYLFSKYVYLLFQ